MQDTIDRIRSATFTLVRRGYDKREVDAYLAGIAEWLETGGGDQARTEIVKHELERVGRKTTKILTAAEDAAESIRADADAEAQQLREEARVDAESVRAAAAKYSDQTRTEAEAYADKTCRDADAYAQQTRADTDQEAAAVLKSAETKAVRMVEEGTKRRREIETVISDLEVRRDSVLSGLEKLSSELAGTATQHKSDGGPKSPASKPAPGKPRAEPGQ
ncbi:MAG: DivIVA domain-containing protein [Actinomycetota bacterium]